MISYYLFYYCQKKLNGFGWYLLSVSTYYKLLLDTFRGENRNFIFSQPTDGASVVEHHAHNKSFYKNALVFYQNYSSGLMILELII